MHEAAFNSNGLARSAGVGAGANPAPTGLGEEMATAKTRRSRLDRVDLAAVAKSVNYHVEEMAQALGVSRRWLELYFIRRHHTTLKA